MNNAERYLLASIREDALASGKMAFISGPRQVGKTTLAKRFLQTPHNYFTWDDEAFRRRWSRSPIAVLQARGPGPTVIDEIHKDRRWKTRLKGLFDTEGAGAGLIITGSARLDLYRRGGDSLMGRYLPYRLHPLTVAENAAPCGPDEIFATTVPRHNVADLLRLGGFPEPFFSAKENHARRWSRLRLERLLAEDVRDLRAVEDLAGLRVLADLLPQRVGSLLSINALREDVGVAYATVRAWVQVLESLYHCFTIRPYAKRIARALSLAPKLYLFDLLGIPASALPARLENLTALHLLKACHYWTDLAFGDFELRFVRDKQQREVDFLVLRDGQPWMLVECKSGDTDPSPHIKYFQERLQNPISIQLVSVPNFDRTYAEGNVRVMSYERFFAGLV